MDLQQHAAAISSVIQAAYAEGFELDDGFGRAPYMELFNPHQVGYQGDFAEIAIPERMYTGLHTSPSKLDGTETT